MNITGILWEIDPWFKHQMVMLIDFQWNRMGFFTVCWTGLLPPKFPSWLWFTCGFGVCSRDPCDHIDFVQGMPDYRLPQLPGNWLDISWYLSLISSHLQSSPVLQDQLFQPFFLQFLVFHLPSLMRLGRRLLQPLLDLLQLLRKCGVLIGAQGLEGAQGLARYVHTYGCWLIICTHIDSIDLYTLVVQWMISITPFFWLIHSSSFIHFNDVELCNNTGADSGRIFKPAAERLVRFQHWQRPLRAPPVISCAFFPVGIAVPRFNSYGQWPFIDHSPIKNEDFHKSYDSIYVKMMIFHSYVKLPA